MNKIKAVEVRHLSYKYPDGTAALEDVSFDIYEGESVGIIGPNGAGKTTLILHLNGVLNKQTGTINICGVNLGKNTIPEIRRKVGIAFQDPDDQLFMATVFDDIAFGPINMGLSRIEVAQRVKSALSKVGLNGYDNRISHHMSYGEKKKASIATILSMEPEIFIFDEPTANLDPRARRKIIEILCKLPATKIIASHDIEMILEICDRAILLDKGQVVINGQAKDILTNPILLEAHGSEAPTIVKMMGPRAISLLRKKKR